MGAWQPVETAPRDGTEVILASWGGTPSGDAFPWWIEESHWKFFVNIEGRDYAEGWHLTNERALQHAGNFPATHWMPLIPPSTSPT